MDAICFSPGFPFSSLSSTGKLKLKDVPTRVTFKNYFNHTQIIKANDKIKGKPNSDELGRSQPSDDIKSAKQEEIIALFRRIQLSISKGDSISASPKRRNGFNQSTDDYKPSTESVLDVLRRSRKQVKGEELTKKRVDNEFSRKETLLREKIKQENQPVTDFIISRPPSNFVKKSPIQSLSISREKAVEESNDTVAIETKSKRIEDMKVLELKELAKSRGIKGYSKLKKHELIEYLKSSKI